MSDRELLQAAIEVLRSAQMINKFSDIVWIAVDRQAWDTFMQENTEPTTEEKM